MPHAQGQDADVLLSQLPLPAPLEVGELQATRADEEDPQDLRQHGKEEREGTRVDARYVDATRVWRTMEDARRELTEWAEKLDPDWAWFTTLTFRRPTSCPMTAAQRLKSWLSRFRKGRQPFMSALWSAEPHGTGAVHIHALLGSTGRPCSEHCRACRSVFWQHDRAFKRLNECWFHHHGIARWRRFNPAMRFGAVAYVTKYVLSEDMLDWGFWTKGVDF